MSLLGTKPKSHLTLAVNVSEFEEGMRVIQDWWLEEEGWRNVLKIGGLCKAGSAITKTSSHPRR